jgi:hypothetical protein
MDERLRFVARLLEGDKMAALCRDFEIPRTTGYKIFNRYKESGREELTKRSLRCYRQVDQPPMQIEKPVVPSSDSRRRMQPGEIRRSASGSGGAIPMCTSPRSVPCPRCSIAAGSSSIADAVATRPKAPLCRRPSGRTICGVPITRASSCSPIVATAAPLTTRWTKGRMARPSPPASPPAFG